MARIPIPFGGGIDRRTGRMIVRPGAMRDARNVYLLEGKVLFRGGLSETCVFTDEDGDPLTHIMAIHPQRTERIGIVCGYQGTEGSSHEGKLYVFRTTALGTVPERLQVKTVAVDVDGNAEYTTSEYWFQLDAGSEPPVISATDTYGKVVLAHAAPSLGDRAQTVYYDASAAIPVQPLMADLDGTGSRPVYFRGVVKHLNYLLGWGYGTSRDADRPEIVRVSKPGEPTIFEGDGYWIVGQRGEPVVQVVSGNAAAIAHKESDSWALTGYSAQTFGVKPLDPVYGVVGSRLAMPFDGGSIFWSAEGPRFTDGINPSQDLALPLDLEGLEPSDLATAGSTPLGFVAHLTARRVVIFIFGQRGYAYSYGDEVKKWSYVGYGVPVYSQGILFYSTISQSGQPTGYPQTAGFAAVPTDFSARPYVTHVGAVGGELLEAWLKPSGGSWSLWTGVIVDVGQIRQEVPLAGLAADTDYDLAFRYRSGGLYTPGYEGATPDDWTASTAALSKESFSTPNDARTIVSAVWSRVDATHENIHLVLSGGPAVSTDVYVAAAPTGPWTSPDNIASGVLTYDYEPGVGEPETYLYFMVQPNDSGSLGPESNVQKVWVGPQRPLGNACAGSYSSDKTPCVSFYKKYTRDVQSGLDVLEEDQVNAGVNIRFTPAVAAASTEVATNVNGAGYTTVKTIAPTSGEQLDNEDALIGDSFAVKLRHKLTQFGVDDYSDYTPEFSTTSVST